MSENRKSVLISGGTGFLGLHACNAFDENGWDVTALDLNPFEEDDIVGDVNYVQGDVRDGELLEECLNKVDCVVHAASAIPTWDDEEIYDATVEGTRTIVEKAKQEGVNRFVYISSAAVYGRRDQPPVTEDSPLNARSLYGKAKKEAEDVCRSYRDEDFCVSVLRPQAMIGSQRLGVFQILFDWVKKGASIPVIGSGKNKYQLLHVEDMVQAMELMLTGERTVVNDTFNVGADEFGTMKQDFQSLIEYAGTKKRVVPTPAPLAIWSLDLLTFFDLSPLYPSLYKTAPEDTYISVERLKEVGWGPNYSNKEALVNTYNWYNENYDANTDRGIGNRATQEQRALKLVRKVFQVI